MSRQPPEDDRPEDTARIAAEAAEHFARWINQKPGKADRKALEVWLAIDPRHRKAYDNLERIWQGSTELPEMKRRKPRSRSAVTRRDVAKGAIVLAAGAGAWRYLSDHPFADFRTAGERRTINLQDGSRVELAAQTRLSATFDEVRRRVVLHEGEAFFRVARDPRPFSVEAGAGITTALGTAFSVAYRNGAARVLVTEHAVNVRLNGQSEDVSANLQVEYSEGGLKTAETANPESALSWRDGWLIFTATPLGDVVDVINRWRGGRLVVLSPNLSKRPITLIVDLDRLDEIPAQLEKALPVRLIHITPFLIVIMPS